MTEDWDTFDSYKMKVIYHEVGHWIVAKALGYDVGSILIRINRYNPICWGHEGSSHINLHPSLQAIEQVSWYLHDRIAILHAGVACQAYVDETPFDEMTKTYAVNDFQSIGELTFVRRGILYHDNTEPETELEQRNAINRIGFYYARFILAQHRKQIDILTKYISNRIVEFERQYEFTLEMLTDCLENKTTQ